MLIIKSRKRRALGLNEPLRHGSHKKPVTRRDFLAQGFTTGAATVMAPAALTAMLNPRRAAAGLTPPLDGIALNQCGVEANGSGKIPFICFDLAGGANIAGSNVLVGKEGGQLDFLSTQGYSKLGLPGNMLPNDSTTNFVNTDFGLAFHSDSAFLRGMLEKTSLTTRAMVNGCVIAARSENDTGNNPHNPMYGLAKYGVKGRLLTLIGSQNSESGGNSIAPAMMVDPANRPTKIDRVSDVTSLVDTGGEVSVLSPADTVRTLETMYLITDDKLNRSALTTGLTNDADVKRRFGCAYLKSAASVDMATQLGPLDPSADPRITALFGANFSGDNEFQKTASVMKLVLDGNAGAGTISMGGFDYHTGDRATGEVRDLRAGRCIGAVLEYAAQIGTPVMIYVFSDGSLSSNGRVDDSVEGRGKGEWTGDNQQTAASFFLVYNPQGRPTLLQSGPPPERHQQIGYYSAAGDVVTSSSPAANNVNLLVQTVLLNYMALHGDTDDFIGLFGSALGTRTALDGLIAFNPIREAG